MDKLKGSGSTFSTSGKRWLPFHHDPKLTQRHARLGKLIKNGVIDDEPSKADQRQAAEAAIQAHPITRIPTGKRTRSKAD